MITTEIDGLHILQSEPLLKAGVQHGWFGVDLGSTVAGAEASDAEVDAVKKRWQRACTAIALDAERLVTVSKLAADNQIIEVADKDGGKHVGPADGFVTITPGLPLLIRAADCMQVIMYGVDSANQRVLVALHAGGKDTSRGIVMTAVGLLAGKYGVSPSSLLVAIGPAIAPEHFTVDVAKYQVTRLDLPEPRFSNHADGLVTYDIVSTTVDQLLAAGVEREHIDVSGIDTFSSPDWFSHRREEVRDPVAAAQRHSMFVGL